MTIALATSADARHLDPDLPLLVAAGRRRGLTVEPVVWDDTQADWAAYDLVVVRSCWDYTPRREEFLAWAESVPRLANDAATLRWNTDKTYLRELAAEGIPVIETTWDARTGDPLPGHDDPGTEWVVKPAISAGSKDTARWGTPDEAWRHSEELLAAGRTSMTQAYVPSVDTEGETATLFFGGHFSHAIRKGPLLERGEGVRQDRDSREAITPRAPTAAQLDVAADTLAAVRALRGDVDLLYARVDLVTLPSGDPVVIELELTEPSVFLPQSDGGDERLLDAVEARLAR